MENKLGINETKELLDFGFNLQGAFVGSLEDGKITLMDTPRFLKVLGSAGKAFGGIQKVGAELLDLSEAEHKELIDFARERFDLPDDVLELLIEDTLDQLLNNFRTAIRWKDRKNQAA